MHKNCKNKQQQNKTSVFQISLQFYVGSRLQLPWGSCAIIVTLAFGVINVLEVQWNVLISIKHRKIIVTIKQINIMYLLCHTYCRHLSLSTDTLC